MRTARVRLLRPLTDPTTYRRWAYLVVGGALLSPYLLLALVGGPVLVPGDVVWTQVIGVAAVVLAVMAATALLPPVAALEVAASRELLGVAVDETPGPRSWTSRRRVGGWFVVHVVVGGILSAASLLVPASVLAIVVTDADADTATPLAVWITASPVNRLLGIVAGLAVLVALVLVVAAAGALLARAAPAVLGPTPAERLAALEQRADRLVERDRLARELHDSVGHALSIVTVQAGAAGRVLDRDPAFARDALGAIQQAANDALADLDHVLGLLRADDAGTAVSARPTPTLDHLPRLVDAAVRGGTTVDLTVVGAPADVPAVVSREAYRITQEGLTNVVRHAPGAPAVIRVAATDDAVEVVVDNPLPGGPVSGDRATGGRGLRGAAERVRLLGGTMTAGPADGRWRLAVRIPLGGRR